MEAEHKQALDTFLAGVERRAYRMAVLATADRDEALDIVQESMVRLVRKYAGRDAAEWPPLFYRILQNQINDYHRRAKLRKFVRGWLGGDGDQEIPVSAPWDVSPDPGPQSQSRNDQALVALEQAMRTLPLRQQQVVLLRIWEGLDVAQTAEAMSCSQGSVKTHLSRALEKLRDILGDYWP